MKYELVKKAFWVGHKNAINKTEECHPEQIECKVIHVNAKEGSNKAKYKFYLNEYLPSEYKYTDIRARRRKSEDVYLYDGRTLCMNRIREIEELKSWRTRMEKLVADNPSAKVYIRSGQWGAYWGTDGCGYTNKISDVGIYDIQDAWNRVSHCGIEKRIEFEIIK